MILWELDHQESWALKNWCFWTVVLNKTLESPFDYKEIKPVNLKGNQSWIFTRRTNAEAESPILATWCKELTYWKRPWWWETLKAGEGDDRGWDGWNMMYSMDVSLSKLWELVMDRKALACCSPWGPKESDMTEWLNWTESQVTLLSLDSTNGCCLEIQSLF